MKVVLVDDEQLAIEVLKLLFGKIDGIEVVGTYTNPQLALKKICPQVDIIFLDMEMSPLHGLEFAKRIKETHPHIKIVYTTAHAKFAVEAFEVRAFDYLLKPITLERLIQTVAHLQEGKRLSITKGNGLEIKSMKKFSLVDSSHVKVKWRTRKVKELFAYFWHHYPNPVHRSRIMEDLWPDLATDRSSALMHTTLYQLRKTISGIGFENPVKLINENYILDLSVDSDLSLLRKGFESPTKKASEVEAMIDLYQGDYLEEENYEWSLTRRQEVKDTYLYYLKSYLRDDSEAHKPPYLLEICLEKMIELEPYDEDVMYLMIDYYGKTGNIGKMIASVKKIETMWDKELNLGLPEKVRRLMNTYLTSN